MLLTEWTVGSVQQELDRYTFMPGWRFRAQDQGTATFSPWGTDPLVCVLIEAELEDATRPGTRGPFRRVVQVPWTLPRDQFAEWFRATLISVWAHEVDEWLRRDGQYVHHPHPETVKDPTCPR